MLKSVKAFLSLLSPHFLSPGCFKTLEFLLRKYRQALCGHLKSGTLDIKKGGNDGTSLTVAMDDLYWLHSAIICMAVTLSDRINVSAHTL